METLRHVLIETLEYASRGIEAVVIKYGDGTYESAPKSIFAEITRNEPDAQIVFTVRDLTDFGSVATVEDIPAIVDECILPDWDDVLLDRDGESPDFEEIE